MKTEPRALRYIQSRLASVMKAAYDADLYDDHHFKDKPQNIRIGLLAFGSRHENDGDTNDDGYPNGDRWRVYEVDVLIGAMRRRIAEMHQDSRALRVLFDGPWIAAIDPALVTIEEQIAAKVEAEHAAEKVASTLRLAERRKAELEDQRVLLEMTQAFEEGHVI